jgi:hypothetical protein
MTTATTFRVDTLHPSRLLCELCGEPVCELPADSEVVEHARGLTARQAALVWPERGEAIRAHDDLCDLRRNSPRVDVPVYVHVADRESPT